MDVRRLGAYIACAAWFGVRAAQADTTSFERFTPTPAGDWSLGVESVRVETDRTAASVVGDYARDPLVMRSGGERVGAILSDQLGVHLGASAPLHGRVLFFLNAPFVLYQRGDDPYDARTGIGYESQDDSEFGNVSFGARVTLLTPRAGSLGIAISGRYFFPSGDTDSQVNASPPLTFSAIWGSFTERWAWAIQTGMRMPVDIYDDEPGVLAEFFDLRFGAALAYYLDGAQSFALGAELRVVQGVPRFGSEDPRAESLAEARFRPSRGDWVLSWAAGPGLTGPAGVPLFRSVLALSYAPQAKGARR
jgi:OmpA-OmpF porin, OOP family